jgi:hypothetical protein
VFTAEDVVAHEEQQPLSSKRKLIRQGEGRLASYWSQAVQESRGSENGPVNNRLLFFTYHTAEARPYVCGLPNPLIAFENWFIAMVKSTALLLGMAKIAQSIPGCPSTSGPTIQTRIQITLIT